MGAKSNVGLKVEAHIMIYKPLDALKKKKALVISYKSSLNLLNHKK